MPNSDKAIEEIKKKLTYRCFAAIFYGVRQKHKYCGTVNVILDKQYCAVLYCV